MTPDQEKVYSVYEALRRVAKTCGVLGTLWNAYGLGVIIPLPLNGPVLPPYVDWMALGGRIGVIVFGCLAATFYLVAATD